MKSVVIVTEPDLSSARLHESCADRNARYQKGDNHGS